MKNKNEIIIQQKSFIDEMKKEACKLVDSIDKSELETILLSGSVSRGDFFPRKNENGGYVGHIDLIVMKKHGSTITAEALFGPDQDPPVPYHCIKVENTWFAILFTDFIDGETFKTFDEARKFSILESQILYDPNKKYENELPKINEIKKQECKTELQNKTGYINYLISDYKTDRWQRRQAYLQLHENLNTAIRMGVYCLYYKNNSYAPAEDRPLYYSLTLNELPDNYSDVIIELKNQTTDSEEDYLRREKLFRNTILQFISN